MITRRRAARPTREPTQNDVDMMALVKDSLEACSILRGGLPSVSAELKEYMGRQLSRTNAACSLQELFVLYGQQEHYSMLGLLCEMFLASVKEKHTRMGRGQVVFAEEQEVMLRQDGELAWSEVKDMMRRAS